MPTLRVSPCGLWTLILLKTNAQEPLALEELPDDDKAWALALLRRIADSIVTETDLQRLEKLIEELKDGNVLETLERVSMHF